MRSPIHTCLRLRRPTAPRLEVTAPESHGRTGHRLPLRALSLAKTQDGKPGRRYMLLSGSRPVMAVLESHRPIRLSWSLGLRPKRACLYALFRRWRFSPGRRSFGLSRAAYVPFLEMKKAARLFTSPKPRMSINSGTPLLSAQFSREERDKKRRQWLRWKSGPPVATGWSSSIRIKSKGNGGRRANANWRVRFSGLRANPPPSRHGDVWRRPSIGRPMRRRALSDPRNLKRAAVTFVSISLSPRHAARRYLICRTARRPSGTSTYTAAQLSGLPS